MHAKREQRLPKKIVISICSPAINIYYDNYDRGEKRQDKDYTDIAVGPN